MIRVMNLQRAEGRDDLYKFDVKCNCGFYLRGFLYFWNRYEGKGHVTRPRLPKLHAWYRGLKATKATWNNLKWRVELAIAEQQTKEGTEDPYKFVPYFERKKCAMCGKTMVGGPRKITCSASCRQARYRNKDRDDNTLMH